MHVLVITNDLPPRVGGIQYYVDQLARGLVAAGDQVTMYGSTSEGWEEFDATAPYTVLREATSTLLPTPTVLRHALRIIERRRPDVVVFGAAFPLALMGPRLRRRTGLPYVGFTHGLEVSVGPGPGRLAGCCARSAATLRPITFVSHWCRDLLAARASGPARATSCCLPRSTRRSTPASTAPRCASATASATTPWSCACRGWSSARARTS